MLQVCLRRSRFGLHTRSIPFDRTPILCASVGERFVIISRHIRLAPLVLPLLLTACGAANPYPAGSYETSIDPRRVPVTPVPLSGFFSCTAYREARLPAITWRAIPFRQEGNRLTGLHTFKDSFGHRDSVVFDGTLQEATAEVTVTAVRADGSSNFTVDMTGSPASMTGQMMLGTSRRAVRLCTLALTAVR